MSRLYRFLGSLLLAAAIVAPAASTGCAARVTYGARIYDRSHGDYHNWDDREDHAFRFYLSDRHEDYRDFSKLNRSQQEEYWNWRHNHPDGDGR